MTKKPIAKKRMNIFIPQSVMDMDCSGQGECQPEPIEAETSDIQPSMADHKLEKIEKDE